MNISMKRIILLLFLLIFSQISMAQITDLKISPQIRLNENLTIEGKYTQANVLCKFLVKDIEGYSVERLSDEYTFADFSFYSQRQIIEPPYYRGDDYNVVVICGTDQADGNFQVMQPVGWSQPIQKGWEFVFEQGNIDAVLFGGVFVGFIIILLLIAAFILKKGGG